MANQTIFTPGQSSGSGALVPTTVKTAAYTAANADLIPVDASAGSVPIATPNGTAAVDFGVKLVATGSGNVATISAPTGQVFNLAGSVMTTITLSKVNRAARFTRAADATVIYVASDVPFSEADAGVAGAYDVTALARIADLDRQSSAAKARAEYEDATNTTLTSVDMAALPSAINVAQSAGKLYGSGTTSPHGVRIPLPGGDNASGRLRAIVPINYVAGPSGASGSISVLVNSGDPTAPAATAGGNITGLVLSLTSGANQRKVSWYLNGAFQAFLPNKGTAAAAIPDTTATYLAFIELDETSLSLVLTNAARTFEYRKVIKRSQLAATPRNIEIFIGDADATARGAAGSSIGTVQMSNGAASMRTRTNEGLTHNAQVVYPSAAMLAGSRACRFGFPKTYDARKPAPMILIANGFDDVEGEPFDNANRIAAYEALMDAGFIVACPNYGNNWASDQAKQDLLDTYRYARDHFAISAVIGHGISMGGQPMCELLYERKVPLAGAIFSMANFNLTAARIALQNDPAQAAYAPSFRAAYGIASDWSNADAIVSARDPLLRPTGAFRGLPLLVVASPADTTVVKTVHSDKFVAKMTGNAREVTALASTGNHGDASNYPAADLVAFAQRCIAA